MRDRLILGEAVSEDRICPETICKNGVPWQELQRNSHPSRQQISRPPWTSQPDQMLTSICLSYISEAQQVVCCVGLSG